MHSAQHHASCSHSASLNGVCGVFGVIRPGGITPDDHGVFEAVGALLKHRGPDGDGSMTTGQALLGMHRLSIIDVNHGWQPFWSEDGQVGVLGNGEIYNAAELREGLRARGHTLMTHSDIEVIAHLYEESGIDCATQLRGMFALVVLDKRTSEVVLIRDRLGEKPLSYTQRDGAFIFSSEQTPLVKAGVVPLRLEDDVLMQYLLHGFVPEPRSIIQNVWKVPAGHAMRISLTDARTEVIQYWDPHSYVGAEPLNVDRLSAVIEDAVVATCTSDVPVGISLSAGLDSSMVAAIATRVRGDLQAFSIGYSEQGFDESAAAQAFAKELGISCHVTFLDTDAVAKQFAGVCGARDEPIADIAGPAVAALSQAAREAQVPVLLTGIGGDELFWGYQWVHDLAAWTASYATGRSSSGPAGLSKPPTGLQGLASWLSDLGGLRRQRDLDAFMRRWTSDDRLPIPLYDFQYGYRGVHAAIREISGNPYPPSAPERLIPANPGLIAAEYLIAYHSSYLRVNGLAQNDRLSMRYSIEARTPLADHRLVELVLRSSADPAPLTRPLKAIQRDVARQFLPNHVLNRPKRGFTPPVRTWLRAIWAANPELTSAQHIIAASAVSGDAVRRELRRPVQRSGKVSQMALRLATLELWLSSLR